MSNPLDVATSNPHVEQLEARVAALQSDLRIAREALERIMRDDEYGSDESARIWMKAIARTALQQLEAGREQEG